jgi:hypothetical protein
LGEPSKLLRRELREEDGSDWSTVGGGKGGQLVTEGAEHGEIALSAEGPQDEASLAVPAPGQRPASVLPRAPAHPARGSSSPPQLRGWLTRRRTPACRIHAVPAVEHRLGDAFGRPLLTPFARAVR